MSLTPGPIPASTFRTANVVAPKIKFVVNVQFGSYIKSIANDGISTLAMPVSIGDGTSDSCGKSFEGDAGYCKHFIEPPLRGRLAILAPVRGCKAKSAACFGAGCLLRRSAGEPRYHFVVYVRRSPRAFATGLLTGFLPDSMALTLVRSIPCRLAQAA